MWDDMECARIANKFFFNNLKKFRFFYLNPIFQTNYFIVNFIFVIKIIKNYSNSFHVSFDVFCRSSQRRKFTMVIDIINQLAVNNEVLSDEFFVIVVYTRSVKSLKSLFKIRDKLINCIIILPKCNRIHN